MSWSISLIGKPENVAKALEEESSKMSGYSKAEFDDALPHLQALVRQNFNEQADSVPLIELSASGHGSARTVGGETKHLNRTFTASIKNQYAKIV